MNAWVRAAQLTDCELAFNWRNDPRVRRYQFNADELNFDEHVEWFNRTLNDQNKKLYIYEDETGPHAFVRFDICSENNDGVIDIFVSPHEFGKGYGKIALTAAIQQLQVERPEVKKLLAQVVFNNASSNRLFSTLDFKAKFTQYELILK